LDEIEVIQHCRGGDKSAFEEIYQEYAQKALRTAFLMTNHYSLAEDAVQETFVQVWRSIHELRDTHAFRAWFFRILVNRVSQLGKRDGKNTHLPLETAEEKPDQRSLEPEDQVERNEELQRVQEAISLLPKPHRVTVILRYYSELSEAEISESLGIPTGTVKSRLHFARERLQEQLSKNESKHRLTGLKEKREAQE
jgi:RNA polymerase sigma-70 factor (ECF subfamily)